MRMNRRLSAVVVLVAVAWLPGCSGDAAPPLGPDEIEALGVAGLAEGYNLLLVTLDTVRADRLGSYGYRKARTPTLDGLSRTGIQFSDVVAPAPITLPSHATIMTGLRVPVHGVRNNGTYRLGPEHVTLAERLRDAGYETAAFIGSFVLDGRYGLDQGFDHYDDDVNPEGSEAPSGHFHERTADRISAAASHWLDGRSDPQRPFFAWLHFFDPHSPYAPPDPYRKAHANRLYDGEISFVDAELGRVLDDLKRQGLFERTLVVVMADHGEGLGDHGEPTHSLLVYESTIRVPLIISAPALFERSGVIDDRVVGLVDVAPTLVDMLGIEGGHEMEGSNLFVAEPDPQRAIYIESMVPLLTYGWAPLTGLRRLDDKLILAPTPEYYDLSELPLEDRNRFEESAEAKLVRDRLTSMLAGWPSVEELAEQEPAVDPEVAEKLSALGYVRSSYRPPSDEPRKNPRDMLETWTSISQAEMLSQRGRHDEALALARQAVDRDPDDGRAWYALSLVLRRMNQFGPAEEAVRKALEFAPTSEGYVKLAQFLLSRKNYPEFEIAIAEARRIEPDFGLIDIAEGDRLAMSGRFGEALVCFLRALENDPVRAGGMARRQIAAVEARMGR